MPPSIAETEAKRKAAENKEALELNRLAGGLTTASALYFVALTHAPATFTYSQDPLALETLPTLLVAAGATWACALYTSTRFRGWWKKDLETAQRKQKQAAEGTSSNNSSQPAVDIDRSDRSIQPLINAALVPLAATPFFAMVAFLFGAPFSYKSAETVFAALYISVLALTPSAMALPAPWSSRDNMLVWIRIFSAGRPRTGTEKALLIQAWLTVVGAILGAVPTALDWGRDWQTWPVTIVWGAFYGNMAGAVAACLVAGLPENMKAAQEADAQKAPKAAKAAGSKAKR